MPSANFTCSICLEVIGNQHPCIIDHDKTCMECLEDTMIPKFEAALRFEYHYPPRWGSMPLYVDEFSEFFDPVFLQDYAKKEQEYRTPIRSRVYCHHQVTPRAAEHDSEGCQGPGDCTEGAVECGTFLGKRSSQKDTSCCVRVAKVQHAARAVHHFRKLASLMTAWSSVHARKWSSGSSVAKCEATISKPVLDAESDAIALRAATTWTAIIVGPHSATLAAKQQIRQVRTGTTIVRATCSLFLLTWTLNGWRRLEETYLGRLQPQPTFRGRRMS